jgi:hypothetical protein
LPRKRSCCGDSSSNPFTNTNCIAYANGIPYAYNITSSNSFAFTNCFTNTNLITSSNNFTITYRFSFTITYTGNHISNAISITNFDKNYRTFKT